MSEIIFPDVRIILVEPSHPGNIGAAARALKTMGLTQLYLVNPKKFPHPQANIMSAGAEEILGNTCVVSSLEEAIAECHLIVGTSARSRSLPWPVLTPKETAEKIIQEPRSHQIALLFGREDKGLKNEELQRCHFHVQIDANPAYSSLNLAAAVQVLCYEIRCATVQPVSQAIIETENTIANYQAMEGFYQHLEEVLFEIEFLKPNIPNQIMPRLRRLFNRARPNHVELNILRGILTEIVKGKKS